MIPRGWGWPRGRGRPLGFLCLPVRLAGAESEKILAWVLEAWLLALPLPLTAG